MKRPENLTDTQTLALRRLRAAGGEVWRAYTLKEALRAIFAPDLSIEEVELLLVSSSTTFSNFSARPSAGTRSGSPLVCRSFEG